MIPAGLTWCDAADVALDAGDARPAARSLERAQSLLEERGLRGLRERAAAVRERLATDAVDLTPRETELMILLARGLTNKDMAAELHLSPRTVRNQLHSLFAKLGVHRRAEAAALAERFGLGRPDRDR